VRLRRPGPVLAGLVSVALLVAACSGGSSKKLIPPPPSTIGKITAAPPGSDYTGIALDPVEGKVIPEAAEVLGGDASLTGFVTGPDGPVGGATVRLERFVGDAVGRLDIVTNADGSWKAPQVNPPTTVAPVTTVPAFPDSTFPGQITTLPSTTTTTTAPPPSVTKPAAGAAGIFGGRYRIRAWRSPDLALTTPQILFIESKRDQQLPLPPLARFTGITVTSASAPDPPVFDAPLSLTAIVSTASVDADGVARAVPASNLAVSLIVGTGLELLSGPSVTNAQGRATFQLRCTALGQSTADVTVNSPATFGAPSFSGQTYNLPLRPCVAPAPTTTTSIFDPTASSTTPLGGATTTTGFTPPTT